MSNNSKRILILTTAYRPFIGGSEIAIEEITKRLPEIDFDIITPRYTRKLPKEVGRDNVTIYRVGWGRLNDKFFFPISGFLKARELIKQNLVAEPLSKLSGSATKYAAIHAYQASHAAGAAWLLKLFNPRLKFVLTLQEGKDLKTQNRAVKFFRKLIIKKADVITAISNYLKDYARRFNKRAKIMIVPNGVDIDNFAKEYSYGELSMLADWLGIKPGERVIVTVSRLVPKNGIDILIKAFKILNCKLKTVNCKLVLIGDGEQKEKLVLLAKELGIFDKVIFVGSVSHAELPKYLKIADVFVRPSRSEGLGSAFLEAMAAGTPIIGTKVGGIPDFLKDGETGVFCKIDDSEDLADRISLILNDKDLAEKLKKNAKELVAEKYNWDKIAVQFTELYGEFNIC